MGRGRAKAKQTKVARELKYNSAPATDFDALQRELSGNSSSDDHEDEEQFEDPYDDAYDDYRR